MTYFTFAEQVKASMLELGRLFENAKRRDDLSAMQTHQAIYAHTVDKLPRDKRRDYRVERNDIIEYFEKGRQAVRYSQ